ncbi:MAG: nuclear transport factor 2 family protein [Desulfoprunum sp.]|nr:nuclear transport factor 2 family protein [Desulfoprunum sp.]
MNQREREVWVSVQAMNRCWTGGRLEELGRLNDYFHETMVAITPTDRFRVEGKEACIAGWSRFAHAATIHFWEEKEPKVQIYNETAIVTYYFEMACDMGGSNVRLEGRDMLTLVKENGRWQVVADQFSPYPM